MTQFLRSKESTFQGEQQVPEPDISDDRFNEAITAVIVRASRAGVDVEGRWKCETTGERNRRWDVEITEREDDTD